jgi:thiol-disulfide isomerase/thioredoxin
MKRRLMATGVALAASAAGVGGYLWRHRQHEAQSAGFWQMQFPRPGGGTLDAASLRGQPLLLNFWATWCPPCVAEMPEIDRFAQAHAGRGWRVLGLALDNDAPVRAFLARQPVSYLIALAGFGGSTLTHGLGNLRGGLPFTVAFGSDGRPTWRKEGETTAAELTAMAARLGA